MIDMFSAIQLRLVQVNLVMLLVYGGVRQQGKFKSTVSLFPREVSLYMAVDNVQKGEVCFRAVDRVKYVHLSDIILVLI